MPQIGQVTWLPEKPKGNAWLEHVVKDAVIKLLEHVALVKGVPNELVLNLKTEVNEQVFALQIKLSNGAVKGILSDYFVEGKEDANSTK